MRTLALIALSLVACSDKERDRPAPPRDPQRERRVIEPPAGIVRPLPPHAIRGDGVGPYRLGDRLSELLQQLPSGPRIIVFEIPGLVHRSVIRAEDAQVLISGEPGGTASTVSVVGPEVAKSESGVHVGSTRAEVLKARQPVRADPEHGADPRLVVGGPPNIRLVLEQDRVAAIAVLETTASAPAAAPRDSAEPRCTRPEPSEPSDERGERTVVGACLTLGGELVEVSGHEITLRAADGQRVISSFKLPSEIVFAAPLRTGDGRDELAIVTHVTTDDLRRWTLVAYRFDGGKITRTVDPTPLFNLSAANARWIGAELVEVELYLELWSRADAIEVSGLLTTRGSEGIRDITTVTPVIVARRQGRASPPEPVDAGVEVPPIGPGAPIDAATVRRSKP